MAATIIEVTDEATLRAGFAQGASADVTLQFTSPTLIPLTKASGGLVMDVAKWEHAIELVGMVKGAGIDGSDFVFPGSWSPLPSSCPLIRPWCNRFSVRNLTFDGYEGLGAVIDTLSTDLVTLDQVRFLNICNARVIDKVSPPTQASDTWYGHCCFGTSTWRTNDCLFYNCVRNRYWSHCLYIQGDVQTKNNRFYRCGQTHKLGYSGSGVAAVYGDVISQPAKVLWKQYQADPADEVELYPAPWVSDANHPVSVRACTLRGNFGGYFVGNLAAGSEFAGNDMAGMKVSYQDLASQAWRVETGVGNSTLRTWRLAGYDADSDLPAGVA